MSLPRIVPASQLNVFKFYDNHTIHDAVLYEGTILKLANIFHAAQREAAYRFGHRLSQDYLVVISPCSTLYRVWVDIRCPQHFQISFPYLPADATSSASPPPETEISPSSTA